MCNRLCLWCFRKKFNFQFTMVLHEDKNFHDLNLAKDVKEDIRSAEQDTKGQLQK